MGFLVLSSRTPAGRPTATARPERQPQNRLTVVEVARLTAAYQEGAGVYELAIDFGINRNTVSSILRNNGAELRRRGLSAEDTAEAAVLYQAGWSLARIGDRFGYSAETIRQALHRFGVRRREP